MKIFESIHKMHLRCFGVHMHPCYQIRFFFVCSRGAPVLARDLNLQIRGILNNNSLCLRFNMTLTTRNMSIGTKCLICNLPQGVILVPILPLYGMPGLAPRMDVLSWGQRDSQISFSNRDTSRNAWNRHWGSFMVDTGILSNNMKFPSHKC